MKYIKYHFEKKMRAHLNLQVERAENFPLGAGNFNSSDVLEIKNLESNLK